MSNLVINIKGMDPLRAALRGYGEASKGKPCPICTATGCDHTVLERLRAHLSLIPAWQDLEVNHDRSN